ncbi:MAG: hypothetical protein AAF570_12790, partial [Bacteroidota bacterium]
ATDLDDLESTVLDAFPVLDAHRQAPIQVKFVGPNTLEASVSIIRNGQRFQAMQRCHLFADGSAISMLVVTRDPDMATRSVERDLLLAQLGASVLIDGQLLANK